MGKAAALRNLGLNPYPSRSRRTHYATRAEVFPILTYLDLGFYKTAAFEPDAGEVVAMLEATPAADLQARDKPGPVPDSPAGATRQCFIVQFDLTETSAPATSGTTP